MIATVTAEQALQKLLSLQPPGAALPIEDDDSWWVKLMSALAEEDARIFNRIATVFDELDPFTTTELLDDWETSLDIPGRLPIGATDALRRAAILFLLSKGGSLSESYLIAAVAAWGYTITITTYSPNVCGVMVCGDTMDSADVSYYFTVVSAAAPASPEALAVTQIVEALAPLHKTALYDFQG
jgi:uncharacterized protein YmfQ (DUF2313 family)